MKTTSVMNIKFAIQSGIDQYHFILIVTCFIIVFKVILGLLQRKLI